MSVVGQGDMAYLQGRSLIDGQAAGEVLWSDIGLSFWGGVDSDSGIIVDRHHPLNGQCITGRIVAIPAGRGSCSGSGVLLELLLTNRGPAAFIFQKFDEILTLGVIVAKAMFEQSIPVLTVPNGDFSRLKDKHTLTIVGADVFAGLHPSPVPSQLPFPATLPKPLKLSARDDRMLAGAYGTACQMAMEILLSIAELQGAEAFLDVTQAHIDACVYTGPGTLEFASRLRSMGAKFAVPTTLNSISIDSRRWREIGMDPNLGTKAQKLAETYMAMGAAMSFTCAPYLLETAPKAGEDIGWAESNAVVFANSVLGARTQKYPDFLDVCIALTGRAPLSGCHLEENRLPALVINTPALAPSDDSFWPLVGYLAGKIAGADIPLVCGLEQSTPDVSALKAFGAAFATTSSAPMFHISGVTPESKQRNNFKTSIPCVDVGREELISCWKQLNTAQDPSLGLISLGNPHFCLEEFAQLTALCSERTKHPEVQMVITTSRAVHEKADNAGYLTALDAFGAQLITDTCWCMLGEPVVPSGARNLMTNSAKYAHYAPGIVRRGVHFGSLAACVQAACVGEVDPCLPYWLAV